MNPKQQVQRVAERVDIPAEIFGASRIEIIGAKRVLLCGQKGIRCYTDSKIVVDLTDCAVTLEGDTLGIRSMNGNELLIGGELRGLLITR